VIKPIFKYNNYREYLSDYIECEKKENAHFSYRYFSRLAGLSSSAHLPLVLKGERNLTSDSLPKFCKGLKLTGSRRNYFKALVDFNQTHELVDKEKAYKKLSQIKNSFFRTSLSESEELCMYDKWFYPLLIELTLLDDFKEEPHWISQKLGLKITQVELLESLTLLEKFGLLKRNSKKQLKPQYKMSSSSDESINYLVRSFQGHMLQLAQGKLNEPIPCREFGGLTIALNENQFVEAKSRIKAFIKSFNEEFSVGENKTKLSQLNIQLFSFNKP